jgi:hypothetical protein
MSTYLQLVQRLVGELGIGGANQGGTVPTTVVGQTGQLYNAVEWIKEANNNLQLMHTDWQFLAVEYLETLTTSLDVPPAHSGSETVKMWDRGAFWLDVNTTRAAPLQWINWEKFRRDILPGVPAASPSGDSKPTLITQKRDGTLLLNVLSDSAYPLTGEFYKVPELLAADGDISDIPVEYHRLIECEAAIKYGNKEAALEVINGMEAEYEFLLDKLRASQLIGAEYDNQYSQDVPIVIGIPGYDDGDDFGDRWVL